MSRIEDNLTPLSDPQVLQGIGCQLFGNRVQGSRQTEANPNLYLASLLKSLAKTSGVDWDNLDPATQQQKAFDFFALSQEVMKPQLLVPQMIGDIVIRISTTPVQLNSVSSGERVGTPQTLGREEKGMFGAVLGATLAKLRRQLVPWVNEDDLKRVDGNKYSINSIDDRLFTPLKQLGLVTGSNYGRLLQTDPETVSEMLRDSSPKTTLTVASLEDWYHPNSPKPLLNENQLPFIRALNDNTTSANPSDLINNRQIAHQLGITPATVRINLNTLSRQGFGALTGKHYHASDIDTKTLASIIHAADNPPNVRIEFFTPPPVEIVPPSTNGRKPTSETSATRNGEVDLLTKYRFPDQPWKDRFETTPINDQDPTLLNQITDFVQATWVRPKGVDGFAKDKTGTLVLIKLPELESLDRKQILGIADFLGVGLYEPELMDRLPIPPAYSIAKVVGYIEKNQTDPKLKALAAHVKTRINSLLKDQKLTPNDLKTLSFTDLMQRVQTTINSQ